MNRAAQFHQVSISINENRFIPALKEMASSISFLVYVVFTGAIDRVHNVADSCIGRLQYHMIGHKTIDMKQAAVFFPGHPRVYCLHFR